MTPIPVLIIDDHSLFRSGIKLVLQRQNDFELVGEAGSGKSRLVFQFLESCRASGIPILEARATGYGRATPLRPGRVASHRCRTSRRSSWQ